MGEGIKKPHDHFFKLLLDDPAAAAVLLRERLPPEVAALLADDPPEPVRDTLVDEKLREKVDDRIIKARLRTGDDLYVYCLMEHQSTVDPAMPLRLLKYTAGLYQRLAGESKDGMLPAILPMVVYQGEPPWTVPREFKGMLAAPEAVLRHCLDFRYTLLDLGAVSDQELSQQRKLRTWLMALKYALRFREHLRVLGDLLALVAQEPIEMQAPLKAYIIVTYGAKIEKRTFEAIWSKHMSKIDLEHASPFAREWFAEGEAKGKTEALVRLLGKRFGDIPPRIQQVIASAALEDLDRWFDRALDAESLEAVFAPTAH